ncbi:MAG: Hg(II)-responsive transcriptional regulator [Gallionellaceae bacterium]
MKNQLNNFTIGTLADTAGVNVETIRFYQRKGLMSEPERPYGSIRRYTDIDLSRVRFIKASQRLGFSLGEVSELLKLEDGTQCNEVRDHAECKLRDVREKLADLHRIETALSQLVDRCDSSRVTEKCPLISTLQHS